MLAVLLVVTASLAAPPAQASLELHAQMGDLAVDGAAALDARGVRGEARSPLGTQRADAWWECVPDAGGACDTNVSCPDFGSLNCSVHRRPHAPFPCEYRPDGSLVCHPQRSEGNDTGDGTGGDEPSRDPTGEEDADDAPDAREADDASREAWAPEEPDTQAERADRD